MLHDQLTFLRSMENDGWIAFGFNKETIKRFQKNKALYFTSWSQNYIDYDRFYGGDTRIFCHDGMGSEKGWEPNLIPVTMEGPWPADSILQYVDYSPFETVADARSYIDQHATERSEFLPRYPLYMWLARKA